MPRQTQTQWRRRNTYYEHRARMLLLQAYFMDGNDYNPKSNAQFLVDMWRRYVIIRMCVLCGADAVVQLWQFSMLKHSNASALTEAQPLRIPRLMCVWVSAAMAACR